MSPVNQRISRHEQAVIQAEVRRLARALQTYRVLHRDALREVAGAEKWHDVGFDRALKAAVRSGAVEQLPGEFYCDPRGPRAEREPAGSPEPG
jgi:hypothetical protein